MTIAPHNPDFDAIPQRPLPSPGISKSNQETGFENVFGSMGLNSQRDSGPQTPRTPSYSQSQFQNPSSPQFPFRKYPNVLYTPSSLSNFSRGTFDQTPSWSPTYNPFSDFPQQSPVWSPLSPGAIGQERDTPLSSRSHQERYGQQKRGQGQLIRRYGDNPSGHHNVVDIDRIRQGTDVRTTVGHPSFP